MSIFSFAYVLVAHADRVMAPNKVFLCSVALSYWCVNYCLSIITPGQSLITATSYLNDLGRVSITIYVNNLWIGDLFSVSLGDGVCIYVSTS